MMSTGKTGGRKRRILIVDDHPIVRKGLRQLIDREPDLRVCGEAGSAPEVMRALNECNPDLVLLDIAIEGTNGIEITKSLRESHPNLPVLILSMYDENLYAERALRAGARGYLMKREDPATVIEAVRRSLRGMVYVSSQVTSRLVNDLALGRDADERRSGIEMLSDRELEIFELHGHGMSTREIAEKLSLSIKTIETHRSRIKRKLRLRSGAALMRHAVRWVECGSTMLDDS